MQKNRITQSIIVAATTLIAALAWEGLENILFSDRGWLWPSISFFILLVFLSLSWVLSELKSTSLTNLAVIHISFLLVFSFRLEYFLIALISFGLFLLGTYRALDEKKARLKIQLFSILRKGLPLVMTGLALIIATAYFFSPLGQRGYDQVLIPKPVFNLIAEPMIDSFENKIPEGALPGQTESELSAREQLKETLYQRMNQELNRYSQQYQDFIPLGLSIGAFFAIKAIGFFVIYLVILMSFIIFKVLVQFKAVKIQEESVLRQVIDL